MAVITFPTSPAMLRVMRQDFGQRRFDISFSAGDGGVQQTRVLAPPRWQCSLVGEEKMPAADAALWRATILGLRGRVNQLEIYDLLNSAPRGTARGSWVATSSAALGATSLAIQAQRARINALQATEDLRNTAEAGSTRIWTQFQDADTQVTNSTRTNPLGVSGTVSKLNCATTTVVQRQASQAAGGVTIADNSPATASIYVNAAECQGLQILISARDGTFPGCFFNLATGTVGGTTNPGGTFTLTPTMQALAGGWFRCAIQTDSVRAGGSALAANFLLRTTVNGPFAPVSVGDGLYLWGAQVNPGALAAYQSVDVTGTTFDVADYAQAGATILTGDWIGFNQASTTRQLVHLQSDLTLSASAAGTVVFEPPLRVAVNAGSSVVWDKPTCLMRQVPEQSRWTSQRPMQGGFNLELEESWE